MNWGQGHVGDRDREASALALRSRPCSIQLRRQLRVGAHEGRAGGNDPRGKSGRPVSRFELFRGIPESRYKGGVGLFRQLLAHGRQGPATSWSDSDGYEDLGAGSLRPREPGKCQRFGRKRGVRAAPDTAND